MTIEINQCNRKDLTYTEYEYEEIILEEKGFMIRCKASAIVDNETLGKMNRDWDYEDWYVKSFIEWISFGWSNTYDNWVLAIVMTSDEKVNFFFDDRDDALEVRDKILQWMKE